MDRQKTNSITELVKIVANEEIDKRLKEFRQTPVHTTIDGTDFIEKIVSSVAKAGQPWRTEEDLLLEQEIRAAVAQIAMNHQRSVGAIKARVTQKQLTLG